MYTNQPRPYITLNGKETQMSLEAWLGCVFTDFIRTKKDPEFDIFQFLVGFYAHGQAERIQLLSWLYTLATTTTGNDLHYKHETNYIIAYFLTMIFDTADNDEIIGPGRDGGVVESEPKSEERDSKRAKAD